MGGGVESDCQGSVYVIGCFSREGKAWSIGGDANADGIFSDVGLVLAARGKEGFRISGEYARSAWNFVVHFENERPLAGFRGGSSEEVGGGKGVGGGGVAFEEDGGVFGAVFYGVGDTVF